MSTVALSMWTKTPQEWAEETRRERVNTRGLAAFPLLKTKTYLHTIVVHFFMDMDRYKHGFDPDMEALFELDADLSLDLTKIRERWGMETCAAIDPCRWTMFKGASDDRLSGFAVQTLFDKDGVINVVERPASPSALAVRARRQTFLACFGWLITLVVAVYNFVDSFTDTLFHPFEVAFDRASTACSEWYQQAFPPDSFEEEGLHSMIKFFKNILIMFVLFKIGWWMYWDYHCSQQIQCFSRL